MGNATTDGAQTAPFSQPTQGSYNPPPPGTDWTNQGLNAQVSGPIVAPPSNQQQQYTQQQDQTADMSQPSGLSMGGPPPGSFLAQPADQEWVGTQPNPGEPIVQPPPTMPQQAPVQQQLPAFQAPVQQPQPQPVQAPAPMAAPQQQAVPQLAIAQQLINNPASFSQMNQQALTQQQQFNQASPVNQTSSLPANMIPQQAPNIKPAPQVQPQVQQPKAPAIQAPAMGRTMAKPVAPVAPKAQPKSNLLGLKPQPKMAKSNPFRR